MLLVFLKQLLSFPMNTIYWLSYMSVNIHFRRSYNKTIEYKFCVERYKSFMMLMAHRNKKVIGIGN